MQVELTPYEIVVAERKVRVLTVLLAAPLQFFVASVTVCLVILERKASGLLKSVSARVSVRQPKRRDNRSCLEAKA